MLKVGYKAVTFFKEYMFLILGMTYNQPGV